MLTKKKEIFWIVQELDNFHNQWLYANWSLSYCKRDAIYNYKHPNWAGCLRAGNVRCVKVCIIAA